MNDLLQKLEAAIAETKRIAEAAFDQARHGEWEYRPGSDDGVYAAGGAVEIFRGDAYGYTHLGDAYGQHIAHNDPARVLRRVARDRAILKRHFLIHRDIGWMEDGDERMAELPVCGHCVPKHSWFQTRSDVPVYPCADVRDLAEDYEIEVER